MALGGHHKSKQSDSSTVNHEASLAQHVLRACDNKHACMHCAKMHIDRAKSNLNNKNIKSIYIYMYT